MCIWRVYRCVKFHHGAITPIWVVCSVSSNTRQTPERNCRTMSKLEHQVSLVLNDKDFDKLETIVLLTSWTRSGILRVALSMLHTALLNGHETCKGRCLAREVLNLLHLSANLTTDLQGRPVTRPVSSDPNPPTRAGLVAKRSLRRGRKHR